MNAVVFGLRVRTWLAGLVLLAVAGLGAAGAINKDPAKADADRSAAAAQGSSFAKNLSQAFRGAANKVLPSVVMVSNTPTPTEQSAERGPSDEEDWENTPFGDLLRNNPDLRRFFRDLPRSPRGDERIEGIGSGVIIDPSGVILTNHHVVEGGGMVKVRLSDGREFKAADIKTDLRSDLAIVRIQGAGTLPAARLGNSDGVEVGDWVLALGDPFGLEGTVTAGIISAKGRGLGIAARENFLQTDAAINPGNSGGPLVNLDGEVIGLSTAISTRSGANQGVGFAVPVNLAKWVAQQLMENGKVRRAWLGVVIQPVTQSLAEQFGVKVREGVVATDVQKDTPAAKAGLQPGDIIVDFAAKPVNTPQQLQGLVEQAPIGSHQPLTIIRDGKRRSLDVTLTEMPENAGIARIRPRVPGKAESTRIEQLGVGVENLTPEIAKRLGIQAEEGVVITEVRPGGLADRAELEPGMVITQANRKPVGSVEGLRKALQAQPLEKGLLLLMQTPAGSRFVVLRAEEK